MYTSEKTTPLPSDDELLTRYRTDGRTEHLAELYTRYTELVYGVALHLLRNRADAEDVVMTPDMKEGVRKYSVLAVQCFVLTLLGIAVLLTGLLLFDDASVCMEDAFVRNTMTVSAVIMYGAVAAFYTWKIFSKKVSVFRQKK